MHGVIYTQYLSPIEGYILYISKPNRMLNIASIQTKYKVICYTDPSPIELRRLYIVSNPVQFPK